MAVIKTVSDAQSAELAGAVLRNIKDLTRMVEAARADVKAPVLSLGKRIDALASELCSQLEGEASRVSRILGVWTAEQSRIANEAKQKAWEDEQRIRRDAEEADRAAKAKFDAQQAELERKQAVARTPERAEGYADEAVTKQLAAQQAQERRDLDTEQRIVAARVSAVATLPPKTAGIATRKEIRFEVTDIVALYEAAPYLVSLVANASAIKNALKGLQPGQSLPGVKHWTENVAIVR